MIRLLLIFLLLATSDVVRAAGFAKGETVRLTKVENLLLDGKNLGRVTKGSEWVVAGTVMGKGLVQVAYLQEDGTWVTPTLPEEALATSAPGAWTDLLRGLESFREQRFDEGLLMRAAKAEAQLDFQGKPDAKAPKDPSAALAAMLLPRVKAALARNGQAAAIGDLREVAVQLDAGGHPALAVALDEGAERLAKAAGLANTPGKLDRAGVATRAAAAERAVRLARQAIASRKLMAARGWMSEGLRAASAHPLLKAWLPKVKEDIEEARDLCDSAKKFRRLDKGLVHAISALDDGMKLCADSPSLRELRAEMSAEIEARTSPKVTPQFLTAAKVKTPRETLEQGRDLYTARCAECHDLEPIDIRSQGGWEKMVGSMSRRANLSRMEEGKILDYLAAAVNAAEAEGR